MPCKMGTKCGDSSMQQWRTYHSTNEHHNHPNYLLLVDMTTHYNQSSKSPQFKPSESDFTTYVPTWCTNVGWPIKHTHGIVLIRVWLSCISSSILIYIFPPRVLWFFCLTDFIGYFTYSYTEKKRFNDIILYNKLFTCEPFTWPCREHMVDTCLMLHSDIIWTLHDRL